MADNFAADLRRLVAAEEGREIRALLVRVEAFLVGFEGDEAQEGIDELLADVRAEITKIPELVIGVDMGDPAGDRSVEVRIPIEDEDEALEEWLTRIPGSKS